LQRKTAGDVETEMKCVKAFPFARVMKVRNELHVSRFLQLQLNVCLLGLDHVKHSEISKILKNLTFVIFSVNDFGTWLLNRFSSYLFHQPHGHFLLISIPLFCSCNDGFTFDTLMQEL
jgi:hypothetical protein